MVLLQDLEKENYKLKRQLEVAISWMRRNIKEQAQKVSNKKLKKMTLATKSCFIEENIEENIIKQIWDFFWDLMLLNIPTSAIENIISAEINYYNLRKTPSTDWMTVISSYHKALDILIENFIVKWFRKFAKKYNQTILYKNDPLEKSLHNVVNKWYILSIWRLFHLINILKEDKEKFPYVKCFWNYLDKYKYIKEVLFEESFYVIFEELVSSEIFWRKRHIWSMRFVETRKSRSLLIGDFKDKNCLIYKLLKMQDVVY